MPQRVCVEANTRPIQAHYFKGDAPPVTGRPGFMRTIKISDLRIDTGYQRRINQKSSRVIQKIISGFDWAKFLPVIVVEEGDVFHIIDGQHRTTAALSMGITEVPCYVLDCSSREAAAAFASINGNVTPVTPQDVWFAELHARIPETMRINALLRECGVRVVRDNEGGQIGDTRSVAVIRRAYRKYGPEVMKVILTAIVRMKENGYGHINGAVINGMGAALIKKPGILSSPFILYPVTDSINLHEIVEDAKVENLRTGNPVQYILTREFNRILRDSGILGLNE